MVSAPVIACVCTLSWGAATAMAWAAVRPAGPAPMMATSTALCMMPRGDLAQSVDHSEISVTAGPIQPKQRLNPCYITSVHMCSHIARPHWLPSGVTLAPWW
jgi:hypothetical protein